MLSTCDNLKPHLHTRARLGGGLGFCSSQAGVCRSKTECGQQHSFLKTVDHDGTVYRLTQDSVLEIYRFDKVLLMGLM